MADDNYETYELTPEERKVFEAVAAMIRSFDLSWETRRTILAALCSADFSIGEHAEEYHPGVEDFERLSGRIDHNFSALGKLPR